MHKLNDKAICFLPIETIEKAAADQIQNTSELPFIFKHVAVMPDAHCGKGSTVGTVIPTKGAVIPAAVGVDIGCGMISVRTNLRKEDIGDLNQIRLGIERRIPMSMGKFNDKISPSAKKRIKELEDLSKIGQPLWTIDDKKTRYDFISPNWREQLGTLGGGNHFIEVCLDETDTIWITLHSGSRGVGNKIGNMHIKKAQELMDKMHIKLKDKDLAYLPIGTSEYNLYMKDLQWAQKFALLNREEMMDRVLTEIAFAIERTKGNITPTINKPKQWSFELERINCHHNFTNIETHFGEEIMITRKGAIQAELGMKGMIPGSMGTRSYIVSGLANKMAFHSAPHGAGRRFSRSEASRRFTIEDLDKAMEGIEHRRTEILIDEIPAAYKDIDEVMKNAKELVKVEHTLRQIINVKGD